MKSYEDLVNENSALRALLARAEQGLRYVVRDAKTIDEAKFFAAKANNHLSNIRCDFSGVDTKTSESWSVKDKI